MGFPHEHIYIYSQKNSQESSTVKTISPVIPTCRVFSTVSAYFSIQLSSDSSDFGTAPSARQVLVAVWPWRPGRVLPIFFERKKHNTFLNRICLCWCLFNICRIMVEHHVDLTCSKLCLPIQKHAWEYVILCFSSTYQVNCASTWRFHKPSGNQTWLAMESPRTSLSFAGTSKLFIGDLPLLRLTSFDQSGTIQKNGWEIPSGKRLHNYGKSPCY